MPISVECGGCGSKFQAPDKLAGKRAECPKCSAVIEVGARPPQSSGKGAPGEDAVQPIPARCGCGKEFRANADLAGKRVKCPACGQA
jgi:DNA-directed RNA polymerase subunit RPC12/RpoP